LEPIDKQDKNSQISQEERRNYAGKAEKDMMESTNKMSSLFKRINIREKNNESVFTEYYIKLLK
jgi:hypothetical protein